MLKKKKNTKSETLGLDSGELSPLSNQALSRICQKVCLRHRHIQAQTKEGNVV